MRKLFFFFLLLMISAQGAGAQADLFGTTKAPARKGFIIGANGTFDIPGADMAKRFGLSYRLGPSLLYKTTDNWMFGAKCDWLFGNKIKEPGLMSNIVDSQGFFITNQGSRQSVEVLERGWAIGLMAGKIFPVSKANPNSGILLLTGVGFLQHKINIYDADKIVTQLSGDYRKGYDRLTNGIYIEQFAGYNHFDRKGYFNFHIGLNLMAGFTKGRRDYLYDVRRPDNQSRLDILYGVRGGWYVPLFRKKSEEVYFE